MKLIFVILGYLRWHYGKAIISLSLIWKNFLFFTFYFFSIKQLFKNFFDPWKRMADSYPKKLNLKQYFNTFVANVIVRIVGMLLRTGLIIIGFLCLLFMIIIYPFVLIGWLALPFILLIIFSAGIIIITK